MSKEDFKDKLTYGEGEWEYFPANGSYPCPFGCIVKQRVKPPHDFSLSGDCRVPYADECCMNKQDKENGRS